MTTWQWISFMVLAVIHTAALFRWGGRIDQVLSSHTDEIKDLKGDRVRLNDFLNKHEAEIYLLKDHVQGLQNDIEEVRNGGK